MNELIYAAQPLPPFLGSGTRQICKILTTDNAYYYIYVLWIRESQEKKRWPHQYYSWTADEICPASEDSEH